MEKPATIVVSLKVEIDAPIDVTWQVLTDLPRYREWNSFCPGVESSLRVGDPVVMTVKAPNSDELSTAVEYLVEIEPPRRLCWQACMPDGTVIARRDQYVDSLDDARSTYFTTDVFFGPGADALMAQIGTWAKAGFDDVARGLKKQAEAVHAAARSSSASAR
jgi:uncharacterized protein YndB with AHSA1/START domain